MPINQTDRFMVIRRVLLYLATIIFLTACGTREVTPTKISRSDATPIPPAPEWIEQSTRISLDNVAEAKLLGRLDSSGTPGTIFSHAFSPDGTRLVGLNNTELLIWDMISGELIGTNTRQNADMIYFSPNKDEIYMVVSDGTMLVADAESAKVQTDFQGHPTYTSVSTYYADEGWLALGGDNGEIKVWNPIERLSMVTIVTQQKNNISDLVFSPDGSLLGVIDNESMVTLWLWENRELNTTINSVENATRLIFSPDGKILAIGTNNSIALWSIVDNRLLHVLDTGRGGVTDVMLFSPDGKYLVNGGVIPDMQVWDVTKGGLVTSLPGIGSGPVSAAFSPDGSMLLASSMTRGVTLWDMRHIADETPVHAKLDMEGSQIYAATWSPDGFSMLFFDAVGPVYVWGIPDGG